MLAMFARRRLQYASSENESQESGKGSDPGRDERRVSIVFKNLGTTRAKGWMRAVTGTSHGQNRALHIQDMIYDLAGTVEHSD